MQSVVVIGTSAGGLDALSKLLSQLPKNFPAPILVVQHLAPEADVPALMRALRRQCSLAFEEGRNDAAIQRGHVYLAPADQHMMIARGKLILTKGARENRARPAIDPLFRSAAVSYRSRVIGVVLTGYLDDGTAGMIAIQRCGGQCVVQDPHDAAYPDMPRNVLNRVQADHVVPIAEMGALLTTLVHKPARKAQTVPQDIAIEAKIAERVLSDLPSVEALGEQVPFNCPGCGGLLWEVAKGEVLRYRCHTGHAYTSSVLLAEQSAKIEETLWVALRMFEERRNLLTTVSDPGSRGYSASASARAKESEVHINRIRAMLSFPVRPDSRAPGRRRR